MAFVLLRSRPGEVERRSQIHHSRQAAEEEARRLRALGEEVVIVNTANHSHASAVLPESDARDEDTQTG